MTRKIQNSWKIWILQIYVKLQAMVLWFLHFAFKKRTWNYHKFDLLYLNCNYSHLMIFYVVLFLRRFWRGYFERKRLGGAFSSSVHIHINFLFQVAISPVFRFIYSLPYPSICKIHFFRHVFACPNMIAGCPWLYRYRGYQIFGLMCTLI